MRNVILQIDLSLDGFIADENDGLSWVTDDDEMNRDASDFLSTADTILLGRVAYQMFVSYWPSADTKGSGIESVLASQINQATKLIFSRTLEKVEWGTWNNAVLVKDKVADEIAKRKALPGKNMLLYAGASIAETFMKQNLIDEYRLRIHPVALGKGKPLFQGLVNPLHLKLVKTKRYQNGAVLLQYLPKGE
jgi:dihydrofolate reductase